MKIQKIFTMLILTLVAISVARISFAECKYGNDKAGYIIDYQMAADSAECQKLMRSGANPCQYDKAGNHALTIEAGTPECAKLQQTAANPCKIGITAYTDIEAGTPECAAKQAAIDAAAKKQAANADKVASDPVYCMFSDTKNVEKYAYSEDCVEDGGVVLTPSTTKAIKQQGVQPLPSGIICVYLDRTNKSLASAKVTSAEECSRKYRGKLTTQKKLDAAKARQTAKVVSEKKIETIACLYRKEGKLVLDEKMNQEICNINKGDIVPEDKIDRIREELSKEK